ncbi:SH3 and PX domain-containing protein 2A-like isoform X2 [Corticium candelabrum]|uniref:SH3 and PX domain-containing protein 2A-like isoform X2 n=1 Tax=Corticium candelabrum TaxID=121492 RepID=UPI002E25DA45|nr:SH3 and PX domain-containing protein 2A-like isoform X2 [Corticium candelabrum]
MYRKYSVFFEFQAKLYEMFPKTQESKLPHLPVGRLHALVQAHTAAAKRAKKIESFCQALIKLPPEISLCDDVLGFFEAWDQDLDLNVDRNVMQVNPYYSTVDKVSKGEEHAYQYIHFDDDEDVHEMEQYRANFTFYGLGANEVSFEAGDIVHVIDKNDNGWWLLQVGDKEGRAPGSYLEPVDQLSSEPREHGHSTSSDCYIAVADYVPSVSDEVQLMEGTAVEVLEKNLDGWWKIKIKDDVGFAPSTYLRKLSHKRHSHTRDFAGYSVDRSSDTYALPLKPPPRGSMLTRRRASSGSSYALQEVRRDIDVDKSGYVTVTPNKDRRQSVPDVNIVPVPPINQKRNRFLSEDISSTDNVKISVERKKNPMNRSRSEDHHSQPHPAPRLRRPQSLSAECLDKNVHIVIQSYSSDLDFSVVSGDQVYLNYTEGGWAFVNHRHHSEDTSQGWIPLSYIKKHDHDAAILPTATPKVLVSVDESEERVVAIESYLPKDPTASLGFSEGQHAIVLEKSGGWWFVRIGSDEGWVPGGFFEPMVTSPSAMVDATYHRPLTPEKSPQSSPLMARKRFTDPEVISDFGNDLSTDSRDINQARAGADHSHSSMNGSHLHPRVAVSSSHSPNLPRAKSRSNVPSPYREDLSTEVWYHGEISRADAELLLLKHGEDKDFLIRESRNRFGNYAISVRQGNKVRHFPVENQGTKLFIGQHYYDKMTEIVKYYMEYPLFFVEDEGISLGAPVKKL